MCSFSMSNASVTRVEEGQLIELAEGPDRILRSVEVGPACELKTNGVWYCVTHRESFQNQFQKDGHINWEHGDPPRAKHVLAWICFTHGPEVP